MEDRALAPHGPEVRGPLPQTARSERPRPLARPGGNVEATIARPGHIHPVPDPGGGGAGSTAGDRALDLRRGGDQRHHSGPNRTSRSRVSLLIRGPRDLSALSMPEQVPAVTTTPSALHVGEGGDHSLQAAKAWLKVEGLDQAAVDHRILTAARESLLSHVLHGSPRARRRPGRRQRAAMARRMDIDRFIERWSHHEARPFLWTSKSYSRQTGKAAAPVTALPPWTLEATNAKLRPSSRRAAAWSTGGQVPGQAPRLL